MFIDLYKCKIHADKCREWTHTQVCRICMCYKPVIVGCGIVGLMCRVYTTSCSHWRVWNSGANVACLSYSAVPQCQVKARFLSGGADPCISLLSLQGMSLSRLCWEKSRKLCCFLVLGSWGSIDRCIYTTFLYWLLFLCTVCQCKCFRLPVSE